MLITRPAPACHELAAAILAEGGKPIVAPMQTIEAHVDSEARRLVEAKYSSYHGIIFISPNAVDYGLPTLEAFGKDLKPLFAVGCSTADRIRRLSSSDQAALISVPKDSFNTEGLLKLPDLAQNTVNGKRILIIRGQGGRELLADTLTARGAEVDYFEVYKRLPTADRLADVLSGGCVRTPSIGVITSLEGLSNLAEKIANEQLQSLFEMPLIVPGGRIAAQVRNLGFTNPPLIADNPSQENIIARLKRWVVEKI